MRLLLLFVVAGALYLPCAIADDVNKPIQLLPAKNLDAFDIYVKGEDRKGPSKVISLEDGVVKINGTKGGFLATKAEYTNYRLVVEYKWDPESTKHDSGIFINTVIPEKGPNSNIEVNLISGPKGAYSGEIWLNGPLTKLTVNGAPKTKGGIRTKDLKDHENKLGEWNNMEVVCDNGKVKVLVNGHTELEGTDAEPKAGKICLQSNQGIIYFRKMDLLPLAKDAKEAKDANPKVVMETSMGNIKLELFEDKAPITVKNFLQYVDDKFYDGTLFHRVIDKFMIQGGGHDEEMKLKPTRPGIKNESDNGLSHYRGTLTMARGKGADTATSQFTINVVDNIRLDRANSPDKIGYVVFGKVVDGMDVVDSIKVVKTTTKNGMKDVPVENVVIKTVRRLELK